ncbi:MAG: hypothetical protein RLZZ230_833 [Candidatus Parcubacteria bacterium]|jgi:hypothetical protein
MENFNKLNSQESKKRSPEAMVGQLKGLLLEMSAGLNTELEEYLPDSFKGVGLVDEKGAVRENLYNSENGGPLESEQIENFNQFISTREQDWSAFDDERVRKFYLEKYGADTDEKFMQAWHDEKIKSNGALAEMAVTLLMHKFLKDDFYVLRTNAYDDYAHGVDNFIVEKTTGTVVCTFDEFLGSSDDDRFHKKLDRERKQAIQHGATITYGLGVEYTEENKRQIIPKTIRDVPTFTLPINKEQCLELINDLGESLDAEVGEVSIKVFKSIIASLATQAEYFKDDLSEGSPVLARVNEFMTALVGIQERFHDELNLDGTNE